MLFFSLFVYQVSENILCSKFDANSKQVARSQRKKELHFPFFVEETETKYINNLCINNPEEQYQQMNKLGLIPFNKPIDVCEGGYG